MRLAPSEYASASLISTLQYVRGHWDGSGRYVPAAGDTLDRELRVEARGMFKLGRVQLGAIVPWVRTDRRFGAEASSGSGVGDLTLLSRYDFVRVGGENGWPGIAATFAMSLPTGRSPDRARDALGSDATGTGAFEARPGFAIEKSWWTGWYVLGAAGLGLYAPYERNDGARVALGPRLLAFLAGGKSFANGVGVTLAASYEQEEGPRVDGVRVSGARARTSAVGLLSYELDDHWQGYLSVWMDLPVRDLGREQTAHATVGLGIRRAWNVYE